MNIVYAFHGRFPDPRAAALFAREEAVSFLAHGAVSIVVPKRRGTSVSDARRVHRLPDAITIDIIPALDWFDIPLLKYVAFRASLVTYCSSLTRYLKKQPPSLVVAVDALVATSAKQAGHRVLLEVHDFPKEGSTIWKRALADADYVLATNTWKAEALARDWQVEREKLITEPNGVDLAAFTLEESTENVRASIPELAQVKGPLLMYTGNFYDWKGTDTLITAASHMPHLTVALVGGTPNDVTRLTATVASNVRVVGRVPHEDIPRYQRAADVLILPNTARKEISVHYTSPLKLFEYMASGRPIVASALPSIQEILPEDAGFLVTPDDPEALTQGVTEALGPEGRVRAARALKAVASHSWEQRAARIMGRLAA